MAKQKKVTIAGLPQRSAPRRNDQAPVTEAGQNPADANITEEAGAGEEADVPKRKAGKRPKRSLVWKIMVNLTPEIGQNADPRYHPLKPVLCLVCGLTFPYKDGDVSTGNMNKHYKRDELHLDVVKYRQAGLPIGEAIAVAKKHRRSVVGMLITGSVKRQRESSQKPTFATLGAIFRKSCCRPAMGWSYSWT